MGQSQGSYSNILFLLVDSLRFDRLGMVDGFTARTPNLNRLAEKSLFAKNAFATGSPTQIACPSIFTSTLPLDHGGYSDGILNRPVSIAEVFKNHGYRTSAIVGGTSLSSFYGYARGFDVFEELMGPQLVWFTLVKIHLKEFVHFLKTGVVSRDEFYRMSGECIEQFFTHFLRASDEVWTAHGSRIKYRDVVRRAYDEFRTSRENWIESRMPMFVLNVARLNNITATRLFLATMHGPKSKVRSIALKLSETFFKLEAYFLKSLSRFVGVRKNYVPQVSDRHVVEFVKRELKNNVGEKKFIFAHFMGVHEQVVSDSILQSTNLKNIADDVVNPESSVSYDLAVHKVDAYVGEILKTLEDSGRADDTLIVFTSDHGYVAGVPNRKGVGLGSCAFYDEFLHVPLMFSGKAILPRVEDGLVSSVDIAPTVLDLCGLSAVSEFIGKSFARGSVRNQVLFEHMHRGVCDLKRKSFYLGVREKRFKYSWKSKRAYRDDNPALEEMFDTQSDPFESQNLISEEKFSDDRERLRAVCRERYSFFRGALNER